MTTPSASEVPVPPTEVPAPVLELARAARRVCVLSGAGMSAESGVPTFRDQQVGLWQQYDPLEIASPTAWREAPERVWAWYAWRASMVRRAEPNAGHRAIGAWQGREGVQLDVVTQNVDDLHERGGATVLSHVHGDLFALRCADCEAPSDATYPELDEPVESLDPPTCATCGGMVRPGVVWFGEAVPREEFYASVEAAQQADLVIVVGTSGMVHPAATTPHLAGARGVPVVEINPRETEVTEAADQVWRETAARALPALVAALD